MRKILFRGRRLDNGEWVYGFPYIPNDGVCEIRSNDIGTEQWAVDHKTVGQYTGLEDKNGNMIFEGDIVLKRTYNGKKPFAVKFDGGMFYAGIGGGSSTATHRYTLEDKQIEIIGNIHDNPELLNVTHA